MINAIALDKSLNVLMQIRELCDQVNFIKLEKTFTDTESASKYLRKFPVDLIFLDMNIPSGPSFSFSEGIPQNTMIILMGADGSYTLQGFNLRAVDYLLKPFSSDRFIQVVNNADAYFKFLHQKEKADDQYLCVRADYSLVKILLNDIEYIEALDDYIKIYIYNQKTIVTRMTMKTILDKLPAKEFIRVHRSFIIPLSKVKKIRKKVISLPFIEIAIGMSYEKQVMTFFK